MTAAEQLRREITAEMPFTKEQFIKEVMDGIRSQGNYPIGISDGPSTLSGWINDRDFGIVSKWVKDEGFRLVRDISCYGVVSYFVEL